MDLHRGPSLETASGWPAAVIFPSFGSTDERGIHGDLGIQELGDRTTGLGLPGKLLEFGLIRTRYLGLQAQMDGSDSKPVRHLFERDLGRGLHVLGGKLSLSENERQCHGEARGMRRPDELFGIAAGLALKAAAEAIGIVLERAALG